MRLFAEPPRELLFAWDSGADHLKITTRKREPGYKGIVNVEATVAEKTLSESYRLRVSPESSRIDRVLVYFSHARREPPRWTLAAEETQPLSARRLAPAEQSALGLAAEGQAWEVALVPSRSAPFEIRATRDTDLREQEPICLAALPEATSQEGAVVVRSAEAAETRIKNDEGCGRSRLNRRRRGAIKPRGRPTATTPRAWRPRRPVPR